MEKVKIKMLKNLKYDFASYEIKYIYETYLKHEGEINLSPSYQREFAWSNDKQDLFIDSVMNNYIIPPIILIKLTDKKGFRYECMDGQHRLTVLKHYIDLNIVILYNINIEVTNNKPSFSNEELLVTQWVHKLNEIALKSTDNWMIHVSTDEFLFPTEKDNIKDASHPRSLWNGFFVFENIVEYIRKCGDEPNRS
jgi:hypothetical protein